MDLGNVLNQHIFIVYPYQNESKSYWIRRTFSVVS